MESSFSFRSAIVAGLGASIVCIEPGHILASLALAVFFAVCFGYANSDKASALIGKYNAQKRPDKQPRAFHWFDYIAIAALIAEVIVFSFTEYSRDIQALAYGITFLFLALSHLAFLYYVKAKVKE